MPSGQKTDLRSNFLGMSTVKLSASSPSNPQPLPLLLLLTLVPWLALLAANV
jgi:hypothetical protein